jgi:hypothetical protein
VRWMVDRFQDAMKDRTFTDSLVQQGYVMIPASERGPEALASQTKREVARWRKVIADAHIQAN